MQMLMKSKILLLAGLLFGATAAMAQIPYIALEGAMDGADGIAVSMPRTVLAVDLTVERTVTLCGPYARYAQKYLGVRAPLTDKTTGSVGGARSALSGDDLNDAGVDDGNTDMILYVHFNNETGEMKMLQIPRDTMVTTDASVSGNYRINGVAKTQGSDSNNNMVALCELVADQYKLPIDGFITIRLEMLTELVDLFGGVEIFVPVDVDFAALGLGDSVIHAG